MSSTSSWTQSAFSKSRRVYLLAPLVFIILVLFILPKSPNLHWRSGDRGFKSAIGSGHSPRELAANATLGFEKLLVLSTGPSWRTRGLFAAAQYTGLHFDIPIQARNPPELIAAFQKINADKPDAVVPPRGSAVAWLAHLDMLKYIIAQGWESAFIVEDDVDWDLGVFDQMRLISDNVRKFVNATDIDPTPFGSGWDVLWLGHCGEMSNENATRLITYQDNTRPTIDEYGGWSKKFLRLWVPEGHRVVQDVSQPVCTFGFGITKQSAQKVLTATGQAADEAFDVALQHHCTRGDLRCISVNPEIMHHYEPAKEHGYVSQVQEADGKGQSASEAEFEHIKGHTQNIVNSARCRALFDDTCVGPAWELDN